MNLIAIYQRFPDEASCYHHLEFIRWQRTPRCPHCASEHVARKHENRRVGRWNCHDCKSSFNVLSGTVFQKTRIPLQKWFLAIALLVNAKKSISAHQLGRDLDLPAQTAWYLAMRLREAMEADLSLFEGIVEADETWVGKRKTGSQFMVAGAVQRGGAVQAALLPDRSSSTLTEFLSDRLSPMTALVTDEHNSYAEMKYLQAAHYTITHAVEYVRGNIHTNTIEHASAYVVEAAFKYNTRKLADPFGHLLGADMRGRG